MSWLSVISITITAAVIGACTTPEKYATMPSSTTAPAGAAGSRCASHRPKPAPTASDGAKMPPGMPLTIGHHRRRQLQHEKLRRQVPTALPPSPRACA